MQRGLSGVSTRGNDGVLQSRKKCFFVSSKIRIFLTGLIIKTTMSMARATLDSAALIVRF